jgi:hypothetical protein
MPYMRQRKECAVKKYEVTFVEQYDGELTDE